MTTVGPVNPFIPDAYVQVLAPPSISITGVQTDLIGIVGTATWGPVNAPTPFSGNNDFAQRFGNLVARKYDMGTQVAACVLQGAGNFRGVRVTDGTDVAATALILVGAGTLSAGGAAHVVGDKVTLSNGAVIQVATVSSGAILTFTKVSEPTAATAGTITQTATTGVGTGFTSTWTYSTGVTITSKYTGSGANGDTVAIATGSAASSYKVTVTRSGQAPEVFDNITGSANALWLAIAAALNNGLSGLRGASNFVVATAGASTAAPTLGTYTLAAGVDGATTITGAVLVGADTGSRTGMYALRGIGPAQLLLADCDSSTTWSTQIALALAEGFYAVMVGPAGEYTAPATVATNKATAGIDSYAATLLVGDWIYMLDPLTGLSRLVSPQGFKAGRNAVQGPEQSSLNKALSGIVGTQSSLANHVYSTAELAIFGQAGLELITNPAPGGSYFACRYGKNTSSNAAIYGDNYSRMIPYLTALLGGIGGRFVGRIQTIDEQAEALAAFDAALFTQWRLGRISNVAGTQPYSNKLDTSLALQGYQIMNTKVQLGPIIMTFLLNLTAGQTVTIDRTISLAA